VNSMPWGGYGLIAKGEVVTGEVVLALDEVRQFGVNGHELLLNIYLNLNLNLNLN